MNKYFYVFAAAVVAVVLTGCSGMVPMTYPDNSLNIYNTYWDNFSGIIEKGKTYQYSNDGFDRKLQFKVLQVLSKNSVLVIRSRDFDKLYDKYQIICEEAVFLVVSERNYADGATLQNGVYECHGTFTYETKANGSKTVYVLFEIPTKPDTKQEHGE